MNKKKITATLMMASVGGLMGFIIAFTTTKLMDQYDAGVGFILLLLTFLFYFVAVALHEAGHAIAGVWVGFDFRLYVVGPFMWEKTNDKWSFKWNTNVNTSGGLVLCMPTETNGLQKRFAWFAAGGPLASLFTFLLFALCFYLFQGRELSYAAQVLQGSLFVLAALSAFLFLITAIPFHMGGFSSDGARFIRLMRGGDHAAFEVSLLKVIATSGSGETPERLNKQELVDAIALGVKIKAPMAFYLYYYLFYRAWSLQEVEEAEYFLKKYLEHAEEVPDGIRNGLWLDAILFYGLEKKNKDEVMKYEQLFKPSPILAKISIHGATATSFLLKGDNDEAVKNFNLAIQNKNQAVDKGIAEFLKLKFEKEIKRITFRPTLI
ncbi:MAG: hypothetical protein O9340_06535 [Cyclobacteriaceae bacterium]|nr:hypothetical protein [Cyclobacteriaceae bacterium]